MISDDKRKVTINITIFLPRDEIDNRTNTYYLHSLF